MGLAELILRVGLAEPIPCRDGLTGDEAIGCVSREDSWRAVMPTYLLARLPAVILLMAAVEGVLMAGGGGCRGVVLEGIRGAAEGVENPKLEEGVIRPLESEGVTRPLGREGVIRPLYIDGVARPVKDGVIRPEIDALDDATDEGRDWAPGPTVGGDSFAVATNTPHFGGH